jgi:hypothetical protein
VARAHFLIVALATTSLAAVACGEDATQSSDMPGAGGSAGAGAGGSAGASAGSAKGGAAGASTTGGAGGVGGGSADGGSAGSNGGAGGDASGGGNTGGGSAGSNGGAGGDGGGSGFGGSAGSAGATSGGSGGANSGGTDGSGGFTAGGTDSAGGSGAGGRPGLGGDGGDGAEAGMGGEGGMDGDPPGPLSVHLCPETTTLLPGDTMAFTAEVEGPGDPSVTFSAPDGGTIDSETAVFTAPAPGVYTVEATSVRDSSKRALALVKVVAPALPSVSGSVSYSGSKTGRIFVTVRGWPGGTTVIVGPGPFKLRGPGLPDSGQVQIRAHMDTLGVSAYVYGADPAGVASFEATGNDVGGVAITLDDPEPWTPSAPAGVRLQAALGGIAVIGWDRLVAGELRLVEHYRVYASESPNPGPGGDNAVVEQVRATANFAFLGGLESGTSYYFGVSGVQQGIEGPVTVIGPLSVAAPTGPNRVSGTVDFAGLGGPGHIYTFVTSFSGPSFTARQEVADSPLSFEIEGVPNGLYSVGAVFKRSPSAEVATPDLVVFDENPARTFEVDDADVSGLAVTLPADDAIGRAVTLHEVHEGLHAYTVELLVTSNARRAVKATLAAGPRFASPIDLRLDDYEPGRFRWTEVVPFGQPAVGDTYRFDVMYADGGTCNVLAGVTGVVTEAPVPISPVDTGSTLPLFEWEEPAVIPPGSRYRLSVWQSGSPDGTWDVELPIGTNSIEYNADGGAAAPALTPDEPYYWQIRLVDADRNEASQTVWFVPQNAAP